MLNDHAAGIEPGHLEGVPFGSERLARRHSGKDGCDGRGLVALGRPAPSRPLAHYKEPEALAAKLVGRRAIQ
jgi:hypothetical protein